MSSLKRWLSARTFSRKQREFLVDALRGQQPEQACWADETLRNHALQTAMEHFHGDWNWCLQAVLAVYFINPGSMAEIDRIMAEHVESRSGRFPPEQFEGHGWNPAEAADFDGEAHRYWRGYHACADDQWASLEIFRKPDTPSDYLKQSGYSYSGSRGCVRHIALLREADVEAAAECAEAFVASAQRLLSHALGPAKLESLWQAVLQQTPYDETSGSVHLVFRTDEYEDRGQPPRRTFRLMLDHV
jgi:hypothetical protein